MAVFQTIGQVDRSTGRKSREIASAMAGVEVANLALVNVVRTSADVGDGWTTLVESEGYRGAYSTGKQSKFSWTETVLEGRCTVRE